MKPQSKSDLHECQTQHLMNGFNAVFENDDDNRLFDTNRPLHYAEGGCFMLIIIIEIALCAAYNYDFVF